MEEKKFKVGDKVKVTFSSYRDGCPGVWTITEIFTHSQDPEDQIEAFIENNGTTRIEYIQCFDKV